MLMMIVFDDVVWWLRITTDPHGTLQLTCNSSIDHRPPATLGPRADRRVPPEVVTAVSTTIPHGADTSQTKDATHSTTIAGILRTNTLANTHTYTSQYAFIH
jgi:hypothetical protein